MGDEAVGASVFCVRVGAHCVSGRNKSGGGIGIVGGYAFGAVDFRPVVVGDLRLAPAVRLRRE